MTHSGVRTEVLPKAKRPREGAENLWHEFWRLGHQRSSAHAVRACAALARPYSGCLQVAVETGSGIRFQLGDGEAASLQSIELLAAALASCTASGVIEILRNEKSQEITGYEVRVEADRAERPPGPFVAVRIHHIVTGHRVDPVTVNDAIRLSEERFGSVQAMLRHTAVITTTFELMEA